MWACRFNAHVLSPSASHGIVGMGPPCKINIREINPAVVVRPAFISFVGIHEVFEREDMGSVRMSSRVRLKFLGYAGMSTCSVSSAIGSIRGLSRFQGDDFFFVLMVTVNMKRSY